VVNNSRLELQIPWAGIASLSYYAIDGAGNVEPTRTLAVKIDSQPPGVTFLTPTPAPNSWDWHNTDVTYPFSVSDDLSGVAFRDPPGLLLLTTEGTQVTGSVRVGDKAGNEMVVRSPPLSIDKTPPSVEVTVFPAPEADGSYRSPVTVTLTASDPVSGVLETTFNLQGAQQGGQTVSDSTATVKISTTGTTTVTYHARDLAGNVSSVQTLSVQVR
jgi:hypothetical protein